ncbi:MAG: ISAzo13 family transposase [Deltaproteobacteria bacterium]|nr:ISAzo13 family transposase [Deltaproteobacteria bacterium]
MYSRVRAEKQKVVLAQYERIRPFLDERARRLWAANEAIGFGKGGIRAVAEALGMSPVTIIAGTKELKEEGRNQSDPMARRQRRSGGGRKSLAIKHPEMVQAIEAIVDPSTRGDPMAPLKWTSKSLKKIQEELSRAGYKASCDSISKILREQLGYTLQGLKKTKEGSSHEDRNAQFEHLNQKCKDFQDRQQPVISVDAKKKELVGDFKNAGREWQPKGQPEEVRSHDFEDKKLGKAIPYGVYDIGQNQGWVSVGMDHDTAQFAVQSIGSWWNQMGRQTYPDATELLITADAGGSNGYRTRLWKRELQRLADESGLSISVCHLPPGTSKWNKIEHRMFCHISQNWRGRPLISLETVVNLIANTQTSKGLTIQSALDQGTYEKGIKISDEEMAGLCISPDDFHGEWNYSVHPQKAVPK